MKKVDIQLMLEQNKKATINWDGMEYYVYPKHLIEAFLKDYKR